MQGMYNYASSIMYSNEQEARRIFKKILNYKDVSFVHSGCYISLARMLLNNYVTSILKGERNNKKEKELISLVMQALTVKPSNTVAHALLVEFYVLIGEFEEASNYLKDILTEHGILTLEHNFNLHLDLIGQLIKKGSLSKDIYLNENAKNFYLSFLNQDIQKVSEMTFCKIVECFLDGTRANSLFALDVVKLAEVKHGETLALVNAACNVYSVGVFQFPEKLLEYALKRKVLIEKSKDTFPKEFIEATSTHIGQAYVGLKKYEDAIKILQIKVKKSPTNTDIHNLANAYYHIQNYDLAAKYAQRALYTQEDEVTLNLLARIYHEQQNHKEAIKYFERELHFRKNEEKRVQSVGEDGTNILSILAEEDEELSYERLFLSFLSSLYQEKEYIKAKIILEEALQDYPNNMNIRSWISILDNAFLQIELLKSYEEELEEQKEKYFEVRKNLEKTMYKYHTWAEQLLAMQSKEFNEQSLEEDMEKIIEILKEESEFSTKKVRDIKSGFEKKYPYLEHKSQLFLTTAEYLYESNQYELMDFAPIVVEYSKVLENELNKRLKLKTKHTLGQLVHYIRENKVPHFYDYLSKINQILIWRNGSAHTSTSTIDIVKSIRETYFKEELLKDLFMYKNS